MKKRRLLILASIIPCTLALSGCFLTKILLPNEEEIVVDPTTIEVVNNLKINLKGKTTKYLYPTLSNSAVKNPQFTFASSNESIALVSEDGLVHGLSVGTCNITIALKSNTSVKTTVKVNVVDEAVKHYDYTIMFYMCGSDLEYNSEEPEEEQIHYFTQDIQEILSVSSMPDTVKILIETGGTFKWNMPSSYLEGATKISNTNLQRWEVDNLTNKLRLVETLPTNYMASEASFSEFLSWGLDDYEADQMGVVLSGHGGGIAGCVYDDNYTVKVGTQFWQRTLRTFEVASAAKAALANSNKEKFTWIGYDCCIMQCADIATINADYFEYMVASQENELGTGWNHDEYLPYLRANTKITPTTFLPEICNAFLEDNHLDSESGDEICYQTLSVLDLSKIDALVTSFNALSNNLVKLGSGQVAYSRAKAAFTNSVPLNYFGDKLFGLCDFSYFLKKLNGQNPALNVSDVQSALNDLVVEGGNAYCSKYSVAPCGVNIFFPEKLNTNKKYVLQVGKEDYSNSLSTKFTTWQNMCVTYGNFGWDSI